MYIEKSKKAGSILSLLVIIITVFSCVPLKKQMLLTDKKVKSYKKKQVQDTIVALQPYEYKVRNGDVISIVITNITPGEYQLDKLSNAGEVNSGFLVNDSGYVDVPVIGLVKLSGLTIEQARNRVQQKATEYLHNIVVYLKLLSFEVSLVGDIGSPMTINSPDGKLSIIDAIALAKGATLYSNFTRIKIIRQNLEGDKLHVFYVDATDISIVNNKEHYYLMPKDIVVFEPNKAKSTIEFQRNLALGTGIISAILVVLTFYNTFSRR